MKYTVYNRTKNKRLGEFEYRDVLFTRHSLGRILRMLLDTEWRGDKIAIVPVAEAKGEFQDIIFPTSSPTIKNYVESDNSYIKYNTGSLYGVNKNREIERFDDLIPLISLKAPEEFVEKYNVDINGKWAFKPLVVTNDKPENKKDLSNQYDPENFYHNFPNADVEELIRGQVIPDGGIWIVDLIFLNEDNAFE